MASSELIVTIGEALDEKNWILAESLALEAIKNQPEDYVPRIYLSLARLFMAGRAEKDFYLSILTDIDHAEKLLNNNPLEEKVDARYKGEIEFVRGACYLALSDWDRSNEEKGFQHLQKALEFYPEHPFALKILTESGQLKHAQPEKKSGCFIATAVYGSDSSPEVLILQGFRDDVLTKSRLGKILIKVYYSFSPSLSRWLKDKFLIRHILKVLCIDPLVRRYDSHKVE